MRQDCMAQAKKHIIYGLGLFVIHYIVKNLFRLLPVTGEMTDDRDGGREMLIRALIDKVI